VSEHLIAIAKVTDENRDALKWLAVAQMLDGRFCVFCGYTWSSRESVTERHPIAASNGAKDIACKPCWDSGKRL
jgi:hypothetical protein